MTFAVPSKIEIPVHNALYGLRVDHERDDLYFLLHDYDIPGGFIRSPRNAPEVHFFDHFTKLYEPWQRFFYGLNNPSGFGESHWKAKFAGYTSSDAFITDYHGSDDFADYINKTNLDKEPMSIKCLACGGNVVSGVMGDDEWFYPNYLDAFKAPPFGITYQTHPQFIHVATNISNDIPNTNGQRYVNPFIDFGGRSTGIPVYYPFMGNLNKTVRYPKAWVRKVLKSEPIPNPYNPPMNIVVSQ